MPSPNNWPKIWHFYHTSWALPDLAPAQLFNSTFFSLSPDHSALVTLSFPALWTPLSHFQPSGFVLLFSLDRNSSLLNFCRAYSLISFLSLPDGNPAENFPDTLLTPDSLPFFFLFCLMELCILACQCISWILFTLEVDQTLHQHCEQLLNHI